MHFSGFDLVVDNIHSHYLVLLCNLCQSVVGLDSSVLSLKFNCFTPLVKWSDKLDTFIFLLPNVRLNLHID